MAAERDNDLPPVQPTRRTAVVRGLRPRLWPKRVNPRNPPAGEGIPHPPEEPTATAPEPPPEAPLTYDDHAHLHGGPGSAPRLDLED